MLHNITTVQANNKECWNPSAYCLVRIMTCQVVAKNGDTVAEWQLTIGLLDTEPVFKRALASSFSAATYF